jgi:hypothetical protein
MKRYALMLAYLACIVDGDWIAQCIAQAYWTHREEAS